MRIRLAVLGCLLGSLPWASAPAAATTRAAAEEAAAEPISGNNLTIYSSLPLQGAEAVSPRRSINGEKLALKQANNKVRQVHDQVRVARRLDGPGPGNWDEAPDGQNARKAAQDETTIAYLGEFNSGASEDLDPDPQRGRDPADQPVEHGRRPDQATSRAPSRASRRSTTRPGPAPTRASSRRTTSRARRWSRSMKEDGCKSVYILNDKEVYGAGLAKQRRDCREGAGPRGRWATRASTRRRRTTARWPRRSRPTASCGSGVIGDNGVQMFKDVAAALPDAKLYGPDGVAEAAFTDPKEGGIPADVGARTQGHGGHPGARGVQEALHAEGEKFFTDFEKEYNEQEPRPVRDLRLRVA